MVPRLRAILWQSGFQATACESHLRTKLLRVWFRGGSSDLNNNPWHETFCAVESTTDLPAATYTPPLVTRPNTPRGKEVQKLFSTCLFVQEIHDFLFFNYATSQQSHTKRDQMRISHWNVDGKCTWFSLRNSGHFAFHKVWLCNDFKWFNAFSTMLVAGWLAMTGSDIPESFNKMVFHLMPHEFLIRRFVLSVIQCIASGSR